MGTKETGRIGEDVAADFLKRKGFRILEKNYWKPWGEIDIVAEKDGVMRFVEVKAVSREMGTGDVSREPSYMPEEQVHPKKLERLVRTVETYMSGKKGGEYQIDVVTVVLDEKRRVARCRLYEQIL